MFDCPTCQKPNNMYATSCQHCGGKLTPAGAAPPTGAPAIVHPPCAKCGHTELVVVSPFSLPDTANTGHVFRLAVVASAVDFVVQSVGTFRAQVCLGCGYTEWYANELQALAKIAGKVPNATRVTATVTHPYR